MRNSYDHVQAAADQLDVRRELLARRANQEALFARLGWRVEPTTELHTAIVVANRLFHGATIGGHPVRQAHELINVLLHGSIGGDGLHLKFWRGAAFETGDLVTYLGEASIASKQLSAMERHDVEIELGAKRLVFESYAMDPDGLKDVMVASYGSADTLPEPRSDQGAKSARPSRCVAPPNAESPDGIGAGPATLDTGIGCPQSAIAGVRGRTASDGLRLTHGSVDPRPPVPRRG